MALSEQSILTVFDELKSISSVDSLIQTWLSKLSDIAGSTVVMSFDDVGNEVPIQPGIEISENEKFYIRSIFTGKKVYFLNEQVWLKMMNGEKFPIHSILSLDTQLGKYALSYINNRSKFLESKAGQSFQSLLEFICNNDFAFDYSFYCFENYSNYLTGHLKEIKNQLYALQKLSNMDRTEFLRTGEIKLLMSADELNHKVKEQIDSFSNESTVNAFEEFEVEQTNISAIILKTALLRKQKINTSEKILKLIDFLDKDLSAIFLRELVLCIKWLQGEEIKLFDTINGGPNLHDLPRKVNGIAWDLMLLRHIEKYSSLIQDGLPTVAYFCSFDSGLSEASDLFSNKGCLYPNKNISKSLMFIPKLNMEKWISEVIGEEKNLEVFNPEARQRRKANRPSFISVATINKKLTVEVLKEYSKTKK